MPIANCTACSTIAVRLAKPSVEKLQLINWCKVSRWTRNWKVMSSGNNSGQIVHIHMPLSPASIILYWQKDNDALWQGNKPRAWKIAPEPNTHNRAKDYLVINANYCPNVGAVISPLKPWWTVFCSHYPCSMYSKLSRYFSLLHSLHFSSLYFSSHHWILTFAIGCIV